MTRAQRASQANPLSGEPGQQTTFTAFPEGTLLEAGKVPIAEIAELALREGQCTNPIYRVHRWFARRLGSQFRAIQTGLSLKPEEADRFWDLYLGDLSLDGAVVLDPFVGGGTSLVEAGRCGARVIGYDIDPVAPSSRDSNLKQLITILCHRKSPLSVKRCPHRLAPFTGQPFQVQANVWFSIISGSSVDPAKPVGRPLKFIPVSSWRTARKKVFNGCSVRAAMRSRRFLLPARKSDADAGRVPGLHKEPLTRERSDAQGAVTCRDSASVGMRQCGLNGDSLRRSILRRHGPVSLATSKRRAKATVFATVGRAVFWRMLKRPMVASHPAAPFRQTVGPTRGH